MSFRQFVVNHGDLAKEALKTQLKQLLDQDVFQYFHSTQNQVPLRSITVFADKFNTAGDRIQVKARLVADGSAQVLQLWERSSPTASLLSTKLILKMAASNREDIKIFDVKGAYLHAKMDSEVYIQFNADLTKQLHLLDPVCSAYIRSDGTLQVRLLKAFVWVQTEWSSLE